MASKSSAAHAAAELPQLQCLDVTVKLALQPYASADPMKAVTSHINKLLFKYDDKLGGVPLAYQHIGFPAGKEHGRIYADQPWIYVEVNVSKLLVFCPVEGSQLTGTISKISDNHVSLLILGIFNASISGFEMARKMKYQSSSNTWVNGRQEKWSEGDRVSFQVASFQFFGPVVNIEGRLL